MIDHATAAKETRSALGDGTRNGTAIVASVAGALAGPGWPGLVGYEIDPIMRPRPRLFRERIQDADPERRHHSRLHFLLCHPADFSRLRSRMRFTASRSASVHQRDDAVGQILVDTRESFDFDHKTSLFQHFAPHAVLERFTEFEHAAGSLPVAVVIAPDHQNAAVLAHDDAGHADRMLGHGCHRWASLVRRRQE